MGNSNTKYEEDIQCIPLIPLNNSSSRRVRFIYKEDDKVTLIWIDANAKGYSCDTLRTKVLFREISNDNCLFFDKSEEFLNKIEEMKNESNRILVVMSGPCAKQILSSTEKTTAKKIIFCRNYFEYSNFQERYSDVVSVCTEYEQLKNCIYRQFPSLKFNLFINHTRKSIRPFYSLQGADHDDTYFQYILLIELLKQMPQTKESKDIMFNTLEKYYSGSQASLEFIEKFRKSDTSKKAIDWYTKDSFVYHLINQAFGTEDVTLWYLFRFYIIDLCRQLATVHKIQNNQTCFTVYRGQSMMPTSELEYLKSNVGCTFSANGFLSTSKDINIAKQFLLGAVNTENHKAVLFEITVNAPNLTNVVFVDIDKYTGYLSEREILFDMNTVFKIKSVSYDPEQNLWKIHMEATDEGTYQMKEELNKARKIFQNGNMNLLFGRMLLDMKQYHKAESYFQMLLQVLPRLHKDLPFVYDHIADLNMRITNYTEAFKNSILALQMKQKILPSNHPEIGGTWNNIANCYKAIGDNDRALKSYKKTLDCKLDQYTKAITQLNISTIHLRNNNYDQAHTLCIQAYKTLERIHPSPYAEMIHSHGIMAEIYFTQRQYNNAEDCYDRALQMCKQYLSIGHRYQTNCVKALAHLYHKQGNNQQAIDFCLKWLSWYEEDLPSNHMAIAYLSMIIGELSSDNDDQKRSSLERALNILEKNRYLEYATIANCLIMLAQYWQKQNDKDKALKYCTGAYQIRKQIYPTDHSIITETEDLITAINGQT